MNDFCGHPALDHKSSQSLLCRDFGLVDAIKVCAIVFRKICRAEQKKSVDVSSLYLSIRRWYVKKPFTTSLANTVNFQFDAGLKRSLGVCLHRYWMESGVVPLLLKTIRPDTVLKLALESSKNPAQI